MLMYDDLTFCCSSHWTADLHREIGGRFKGEKKKKKKKEEEALGWIRWREVRGGRMEI